MGGSEGGGSEDSFASQAAPVSQGNGSYQQGGSEGQRSGDERQHGGESQHGGGEGASAHSSFESSPREPSPQVAREPRESQPSEFRAPPPPPQNVSAPEPRSEEFRPKHSEHAESGPAAHFDPTPRPQPTPRPEPAPTSGDESSGGAAAKPFVVWSSAPSRDQDRE
jgi:hypothetical protein